LYQFHYQVLKDELGEDPNLIAQALTPRVAASNVNTAQDAANNATGYMYDAYRWVMADTAKKICCLLKDSVTYGSKIYRKILKETDVANRMFSAAVQMLPDAQEIAKFEALMGQAIASNPDLILYIDPFQLMRIAKEDAKLAEVMFRQGQKKMIQSKQEQAAQQSQMNAQVQMQSSQAAEQAKQATMQMEFEAKSQIETIISKEKQKQAIINGIFGIYQRGMGMPNSLKSLEAEIIQNLALPLFAENQSNMQMMQQQQEEEAMAQQQQGQGGEGQQMMGGGEEMMGQEEMPEGEEQVQE
jgi:hypothetical protein